MKAPLFWIKDYVDVDCSAEELKAKLFSCGFEVEDAYPLCGKTKNVVTCKILSIEKHPDADKLSVTKVDAGKYGTLQIVTNAKNIKVGDIVPVCVDGGVLFDGTVIKKGALRGVPSDGMFCGGAEIGINDDWYEGASFDGVLVFNDNFPLGEEVTKLLGTDDIMFDINVTANRPDCQSVFGIAREVAAVLNKPIKEPDFSFVCDKSVSTKKTVNVKDEAADLCPRYISHLVSDIKIDKSPLWMKRRLFSVGIRSINNIVDVTNFVLTELGQPMHAFDLNDLSGSSIIIRRAIEGEKIITLDEKEFSLNENVLVICDDNKPVALAGIMGGLNSGIKDSTANIVFEAAKFKRDNIRKSSRLLGQRSDSSSRFEKGVDSYTAEMGMKRALNLVNSLKIGKIACDEYDLNFENNDEHVINTTFSKINGVLGIEIDKQTIVDILKRLSFDVSYKDDNIKVIVPPYREDMESYPDIAEEIIREYGYDNITPTLLKTSAITGGGRNYLQKKSDDIKNLLIGYGFNETITYSFVSEKEFDLFGLEKNPNELVKIVNPIGEDMAVMRTSLLPSAVRTVCYNLNRKNMSGRIFELAKTYKAKSVPVSELPIETPYLVLAAFGENEDYFTIKGVIEGILDNFCFGADVKYTPCDLTCMHPTRSAFLILNGVKVGYFGQLSPEICEKLDADKPIYVAEINYEMLSSDFRDKIVFKPISKFPKVERDLAITVDDDVLYGDIVGVIEKSAGELLGGVSLFDVYRGEQVEKGKKSMAFNLVFRSDERTLNVEEIDIAVQNVLKALRDKFGAQLR